MKDNDEQNVVKNDEGKQSRRSFLKFLTLATAGSALAITQSDKVLARYLDLSTTNHVTDFLNKANSAVSNSQTQNLMTQALNNITNLMNSNANVQNTVNELIERLYAESSSVEIPQGQRTTELGLPEKISDIAAAAYLNGLYNLKSKGVPSKEFLAGQLSDPSNVLNKIEPGFVTELADKISSTWRSNRTSSIKLNSATSQLKYLDDNLPSQQKRPCFVNGQPAPSGMCTVIIIIIIIVVISKL